MCLAPVRENNPHMNQVSTLKETVDEGKTAADDLEYGRHAVTQIKDPRDYHGKHRSDDAFRRYMTTLVISNMGLGAVWRPSCLAYGRSPSALAANSQARSS